MIHRMTSVEAVTFGPVLASLEQSGLDLPKAIIHGGAALARRGLRLAGDVDIFAQPSYYDELEAAGQTPGGWPLYPVPTVRKRRRMIADAPEGLLPLDISTPVSVIRSLHFAWHRKMTSDVVQSPIGDLHVTKLSYLEHQKQAPGVRERDRDDVSLISAYSSTA